MNAARTPTYLDRLFELFGGPTQVARYFGIRSVWAVCKWRHHGVPGNRVLELCRAVSWQVTPHQLRPDIYPHPLDGLPKHKRSVKSPLEASACQ